MRDKICVFKLAGARVAAGCTTEFLSGAQRENAARRHAIRMRHNKSGGAGAGSTRNKSRARFQSSQRLAQVRHTKRWARASRVCASLASPSKSAITSGASASQLSLAGVFEKSLREVCIREREKRDLTLGRLLPFRVDSTASVATRKAKSSALFSSFTA